MKCPNCQLALRKMKEKLTLQCGYKNSNLKPMSFNISVERCPKCLRTKGELESIICHRQRKLDDQKTMKCPKCGRRIRRGSYEDRLLRTWGGKEELVGVTSVSNYIWKCKCGYQRETPWGGLNILVMSIEMGGGQEFFPPDWQLLKRKKVWVYCH